MGEISWDVCDILEDATKTDPGRTDCGDADWVQVEQNRDQCSVFGT
jgi:hypothetical protein